MRGFCFWLLTLCEFPDTPGTHWKDIKKCILHDRSALRVVVSMCTAPVGVADRALPVLRSHAAPAADAVAAAAAHRSGVPQFSQRPLAASAGPLTVLPGETLRTSPPKLLEVMFHPPEMKMEENTNFKWILHPQNDHLHITYTQLVLPWIVKGKIVNKRG